MSSADNQQPTLSPHQRQQQQQQQQSPLEPDDVQLRETVTQQQRLQQYYAWVNDTRRKTERAAVDWPPPTKPITQRVIVVDGSDKEKLILEQNIGRQLLDAVLNNKPVATVSGLLSSVSHPDQVVDTDGNTALILAAKNANLALVDLLLGHGSSVDQADVVKQRTALMCAVKTGNVELVERLLSTVVTSESDSFERQDIDGNNVLILAAKYGHCSIVELLLRTLSEGMPQHYAHLLDRRNKHGQTALHEAAKRGHVAIAAALIFAGAKADQTDRWLNNPLHYATLHGHTAVVALLAGQYCQVNAVNLGGRAALHTAAKNGLADIVDILLQAGAITTLRDSDGDTPTLLAGRYQHNQVFTLLVNASSMTEIFDHSDSFGKNAFHYAAANGYIELVVGILQKFTQYHEERYHTRHDDVIDYSRAPDWPDKKGNTAIILAVRRNHVDIVRSLLNHNCKADSLWQGPGDQSYSLFDIALRNGATELLTMLADVGADTYSSRFLADVSPDILANDDIMSWLRVKNCQPSSLRQLCRLTIRRLLSCNIQHDVIRLPLPATLQQYISIVH